MTRPNHNLVQAARTALDDAMARDDAVIVLGEDVAGGGPFALTKGLIDRHGAGRVRNTPICEGAFMGAGVGCALAGGKPFVDIMFNDFITAASDQLFNHAAKIRFMSGGQHSVPLTTWTLAGAGTRWAAQHSQHLEGWFAQVPGLKVLSPVTSALMSSAMTAALDDPDPVVLLVDRSLLYSRTALPGDDGSPWEPRVVQEGDDVTLVATGRLVHLALEAAAAAELSVEVIDLQRLAPLDVSLVLRSLEKTSRLVIAQDEVSGGAMGAIVEAAVYDAGFWLLDGPIRRVSSPHTPVPAAAELEDAYMVGADDLLRELRRAMVGD